MWQCTSIFIVSRQLSVLTIVYRLVTISPPASYKNPEIDWIEDRAACGIYDLCLDPMRFFHDINGRLRRRRLFTAWRERNKQGLGRIRRRTRKEACEDTNFGLWSTMALNANAFRLARFTSRSLLPYVVRAKTVQYNAWTAEGTCGIRSPGIRVGL